MVEAIREKVLLRILLSRNKLVEDLLLMEGLPEKFYLRGLEIRNKNWAKDAEIWEAAKKDGK